MAAARGASTSLPVACALLLQWRAAALSALPARPDSGRHVSLLGLSAVSGETDAKARAEAEQAGVWRAVPSDWFTGDSMESSSDSNAPPGGVMETGWTPPFRHPGDGTRSQVKSPKWFHESESGGGKAAWQTHYPEVKNEFHHSQNWQVLGYQQWEYTPEGWLNDPKPDWLLEKLRHQPGTKDASWFDTSAGDIDIYGRRVPPPRGTAQWLLAQPEEPAGNKWFERAINTTIMCATPGCTGSSSLQAYNPATEEARLCRLNIGVHPTDFDDNYGKEPIDSWKVNGYNVKSECDPMARGCNATAWRPLYSCLREMDVDHVVDPTKGSMAIEGKLNKMVDECPYKGNYLSAVAVVTCLVRDIPALYAASHGETLATAAATPFGSATPQALEPLTVTAELACDSPGCRGVKTFYVDPTVAFYGGKCKMNVMLTPTDFDDTSMSTEFLEYVELKGYGNLTKGKVYPGKNPCNEEYAGLKVPEGHVVPKYTVAKGVDVTAEVLSSKVGLVGTMQIEGKISDMVDECGYQDKYLLHATVEVTCIPPSTMTAPEKTAAEATEKEFKGEKPYGSQETEGLEVPTHILAKRLRERSALVSRPSRA